MNIRSWLPFLASSVMAVFFFSRCATWAYTNDPAWNEVTSYLTDTTRTKEELLTRMDPDLYEMFLPEPGRDTAKVIIEFFKLYKNNHKYVIEGKTPDSIRLCFNPYEPTTGGPAFELKRIDSFWKVMAVIPGE